MSIERVTDLAANPVEGYDVAIFASGYERRCTFVPSQLQRDAIKHTLVVGFEDLAETEPRQQHDNYFRSEWKVEPSLAAGSNDFVVQSALNDLVSNGVAVHRILVDYSSMSRLWYSGILNWARFGQSSSETTIDFVYAVGKYEDADAPMVIEEMMSIPGCEGISLHFKKALAIFGLGFNGWASLCILERLEADDVYAFIAAPGASDEHPARVRELNRDFLEEPRVQKHVPLELPLRSVEKSYRFMSELLTPRRFEDNITIVPMGPKPHVLASMLTSMRFPEVACMRVSARRACPEHVEATGETIWARVSIKRE